MLNPRKHDVFISYSRRDCEFTKKICQCLEEQDIRFWIDKKNIHTAEYFESEIVKAIKESIITLYIHSEVSKQRRWVIDELDFSFKMKNKILPIKLDNSNFPVEFRPNLEKITYIESHDSFENLCGKLSKDIRKILDNTFNIYICYADVDCHVARLVYDSFKELVHDPDKDTCLDCWQLRGEIPPDRRARYKYEAIKNSRFTVLIHSKNTCHEGVVKEDLHLSYQNGNAIIPYIYDDSELKRVHRYMKNVEEICGDSKNCNKLIKSVETSAKYYKDHKDPIHIRVDNIGGVKSGEVVELKATVVNIDERIPLSDLKVKFMINDECVGEKITNVEGEAVCKYTILDSGDYSYYVEFKGNNRYEAGNSKKTQFFTDKISTKINVKSIASVKVGDVAELKATVIDSDEHVPLSDLNVKFVINGECVGERVTNMEGEAICKYTIPNSGDYSYHVEFKGNNEYCAVNSIKTFFTADFSRDWRFALYFPFLGSFVFFYLRSICDDVKLLYCGLFFLGLQIFSFLLILSSFIKNIEKIFFNLYLLLFIGSWLISMFRGFILFRKLKKKEGLYG